MSFDLTNKNIQDTFQNLLQKTGSEGKLFDLVGNEITDLTIGGTLTAHSYITSESIVNTSSGSTAFGNSSDDSHLFTGNITASGNIIGNDTTNITNISRIELDKVRADADQFVNIQLDTGGIKFDVNAGDTFNFNGELFSNADLNYYDANEDIIFNIDQSVPAVTIGTLGGVPNTTLHVNGTSKFTQGTQFLSHITASGNISSSATSTGSFGHVKVFGAITASNVQVDAGTLFIGGEPFTRQNIQTLKQGRTLKPLRAGKARPDFEAEDGRFDGNITASGDILNTQVVQMTNSSSVINTFDIRSHETCKYVLQVKSGSHIQASEMLVMASGSTAINTEYAQINSGLNLLNFSSKMTGKTVEIISSGSFISCSVKFVRTLI